MLSRLKTEGHVVGAKQTMRAIAGGRVVEVFLAENADPRITEPVRVLSEEKSIPVQMVSSMEELGAACSIAVGAAVAAVVSAK
ncbi:Ribosome-associated protein L7Ae-like protein [bioreactor metagenome]|uniref:Ribosome-associated protein L7Ae-like protein n=1 Tax=bioreactor metagenome TaxID=1076179 RepID=A0A645FFJ4_9ZZZZ